MNITVIFLIKNIFIYVININYYHYLFYEILYYGFNRFLEDFHFADSYSGPLYSLIITMDLTVN